MFRPNLSEDWSWLIVLAIAFILSQVLTTSTAFLPPKPPPHEGRPADTRPLEASLCSQFVGNGTGQLAMWRSKMNGIDLIERIEMFVARSRIVPGESGQYGWMMWPGHRLRGDPSSVLIPDRLTVGASWTVGLRYDVLVLAAERIELPAGSFDGSVLYYNDRAAERGWRVEAWIWLVSNLGVVHFKWKVTRPQGQTDEMVVKLAEINEPCSAELAPSTLVQQSRFGPVRIPGPPRVVNVSFGRPVIIIGRFDKQVLRKVFEQHLAQIRYCYEKELVRDPNLHGELTAQFTVSADGSVKDSKVATSTLGNEMTERCVESKISTWTFPKPTSGRSPVINLPIVFSSA